MNADVFGRLPLFLVVIAASGCHVSPDNRVLADSRRIKGEGRADVMFPTHAHVDRAVAERVFKAIETQRPIPGIPIGTPPASRITVSLAVEMDANVSARSSPVDGVIILQLGQAAGMPAEDLHRALCAFSEFCRGFSLNYVATG